MPKPAQPSDQNTESAATVAATIDTEAVVKEAREREQKRIQEIFAIGERFNMINDAQAAIKENVGVDAFREKVLSQLESKRAIDTQQSNLDLSDSDKKKYSLSRLLSAMVEGHPDRAGFELEISRELQKKLNRKPEGVFIPHEVLVGRAYTELSKRDLLASGGASPLVATDLLPESFIELLRNRIVVQQLGVLTLTGLVGDVDIPKQTGAATAEWINPEGAAVTPSDQTFGTLSLTPKSVGADTIIGRQAILQANPSIEALVMNDLIRVLALAIDLGAINGSGLAGQPTGILNTSGIGSVTGTTLAWAGVVEFETDVAAANGDVGSMHYLTNAAVRGLLKTRLKDAGSGMFLMEKGEMNGYSVAVSNQVPASTMIFGAFNQIIMAFWGVLDLLVDPYTLSANRKVKILSTQSVDIGVRHAVSFSASSNIT